jgi:cyclitol reductase
MKDEALARRQRFMIEATAPHLCSGVSLNDGKVVNGPLRWHGSPPNFAAAVNLAGLCRSDLKEATGGRAVRSDFAHELVLTVLETPSDTCFRPGDRVVFDPHVPLIRAGGFSKMFFARASANTLSRAFYRIPDAVRDEMAVLCEPMACAMHAARTLQRHYLTTSNGALKNVRIGFTAAGLAAVLQAKILRIRGAHVQLFNRSAARLEGLRRQCVAEAVGASILDDAPSDAFDAVVAAGAYSDGNSMREAIRIVRPKGVVLLFGGTHPGECLSGTKLNIDDVRRGEKLEYMTIDGKSIYIAGTYGALSSDFEEAIALLGQPESELCLESILGDRVNLAELPTYIHDLNRGIRRTFGKSVIVTQCC